MVAAAAPALATLKIHVAAIGTGSGGARTIWVVALADVATLALAHAALLMLTAPEVQT